MTNSISAPRTLAVTQLTTVSGELSDSHGYMKSISALRIMGHAASVVAGPTIGQRFVALSTERVSFLRPVPIGHTIAFRGQLSRIADGTLRVEIEGMTRSGRDEHASCAMTGSFILGAVDERGQRIPLNADHPALKIA